MTETATTVGTVFARSWGYDQTNVDFYEVTSVSATGKSGKARKIRSASSGHGDSVVASTADDRFEVRQGCARCSNYHEGEQGWDGHKFTTDYTWQARTDSVTVGKGEHAYRWNGKSLHVTAFGSGH